MLVKRPLGGEICTHALESPDIKQLFYIKNLDCVLWINVDYSLPSTIWHLLPKPKSGRGNHFGEIRQTRRQTSLEHSKRRFKQFLANTGCDHDNFEKIVRPDICQTSLIMLTHIIILNILYIYTYINLNVQLNHNCFT